MRAIPSRQWTVHGPVIGYATVAFSDFGRVPEEFRALAEHEPSPASGER